MSTSVGVSRNSWLSCQNIPTKHDIVAVRPTFVSTQQQQNESFPRIQQTLRHNESFSGIQHTLLQNECFSRIQQARVIVCVRATSGTLALDMARAALDGGLSVLEVTMDTPGATEAISKLVEDYPSALIGAGTVLSRTDADLAKSCGAKFLMSPVSSPELIQFHVHEPTLIIPGAITPNEVVNAFNCGAKLVKLYPLALMGGLKLVQALRKPFPHIPLVASQGITFEMFEQYLSAGVTAVVLSDAIFHKALLYAKDFKKIKERASVVAERAANLGLVV